MVQQRTVLFSLCGLSPAVITETIWALAQESPPIIPHEIIVLTTSRGKEALQDQLFASTPSVWEQLRERLSTEGHDLTGRLQFSNTQRHLRLLQGSSGILEDVQSAEDNEDLANAVLKELRPIAQDRNTVLIGSLAGGRKSMSALLHVCFCLCAKPQDRLTHILVNHPFDKFTKPLFYFPPQPAREHLFYNRATETTETYPSDSARLELADIPFFPIQSFQNPEPKSLPDDFMDLVYTLQKPLLTKSSKIPEIYLEMTEGNLAFHCEGIDIPLSPQEFVVYLLLVQYAKMEKLFPNQEACLVPYQTLVEEIPNSNRYPATLRDKVRSWKNATTTAPLRKRLGDIRAKIERSVLSPYVGKLIPIDRNKPNLTIKLLGIGSNPPAHAEEN